MDGNFLPGYAEGRTTTHEVGHWLDLFHIWGDDQNASNVCSGSDSCADTPNQGVQNQSDCPGFPHLSCNNGPNGDMFMNYMDYTLDACKNIYTEDQTNRMRAIFATGGPRFSFINNYFHVNPQSTAICTTAQVSATNLSCLPITWSVISGPAVIQSGQGTNTITLQKTGDGAAVVSATAGGYTDQETIAVGKVQPGPITFYLIDPYVGRIQAGVDPVPGAISYNWYKNGALQTGHGSFIQFPIARNVCNVYYDIAVEAINACGTSSQTHANAYVPPCNNSFTVSPNPASNSINVSPDANSSKLSTNITIDEIRIYDLPGTLKKYQKFNKAHSATINIQGFTHGSYFIEITSGTYQEKHQLIIQ